MAALPVPDLPPGPHRDLVEALHDLHHRAGWPSLRTLARAAGISHTTVSKTFSTSAVPTWGTLELLVEVMDGDTGRFHRLWLATTTRTASTPLPATFMAGRTHELGVVRRHLEAGTGLLLVTGEAGMGKTRLLAAARSGTDTFVALGACLPLSTSVPLMPVADALREVHESDGGRWLEDAVADCSAWVRGTLAGLLPELAPLMDEGRTEKSMAHLAVALRSVLSALAQRRPLAIAVEDLHWSDTATLDLVEHLVARGPVRLVGTWRLDDPDTVGPTVEWFNRIRRLVPVTTVMLAPLDQDETGEQLAMLMGRRPSPSETDAIYARSLGLPLFTEQLAAQDDVSVGAGPALLGDLLDARLGELAGNTWRLARALGVAERPLTSDIVAAASGLSADEVTEVLHTLAGRHLLADTTDSTVMLRHPLLAEAIRRRLVPGEAQAQHRHIAQALSLSTTPVPAEVAGHWAAAGDAEQELRWRLRAAVSAHERFALRHEVDQWVRALELWPKDIETVGDPPVRRYEAVVAALDLIGGVDLERARALVEDALSLAPSLPPPEAAEVWQRAGGFFTETDDPERGLALVDRALAVYVAVPPCEGHVRALFVWTHALRRVGRYAESATAAERGVEVAAALDDPSSYRRMVIQKAWTDAKDGARDAALRGARVAAELVVPGPDPRGDVFLAGSITDILLLTAGDVEDVVRAARSGLEAADAWGLDTYAVTVLRYNVALAMRRAGQVERAWAFLEQAPTSSGSGSLLSLERVVLETLRGHRVDASALSAALEQDPWWGVEDRIEAADSLAEVDLWTGDAGDTFRRLVGVIREAAPTEAARDTGPALARAARVAADRGDVRATPVLTSLLASCSTDPFGGEHPAVDGHAWSRTWHAEIARLRGDQTVDDWVAAATKWDDLTRPHDAAYCRWRAAQVALRQRHGTVAARLLKCAARDAREHVPLSAAIAATAAQL